MVKMNVLEIVKKQMNINLIFLAINAQKNAQNISRKMKITLIIVH